MRIMTFSFSKYLLKLPLIYSSFYERNGDQRSESARVLTDAISFWGRLWGVAAIGMVNSSALDEARPALKHFQAAYGRSTLPHFRLVRAIK